MKNPQGEQLAVIANHVAEARYWLSVPEQRLILWLVAQIEREDDAFRKHVVSVAEMEAILGGNNGRLYEQLEEVCNRIQSRVLEIFLPDEGIRRKINWLEEVDYIDGEGKITLKIHTRLKPVFLQLHERFCSIPIKEVFRLRGGYAIRWLEMVYAKKHYKTWEMTVEELRSWLGIEDKELPAVKDLRARAIDVPKKELDEKSEWSFSYVPKKLGKAITGWTFTVRANKPRAAATKGKEKGAVVESSPEMAASIASGFEGFKQLRQAVENSSDKSAKPAASAVRSLRRPPADPAAAEQFSKRIAARHQTELATMTGDDPAPADSEEDCLL